MKKAGYAIIILFSLFNHSTFSQGDTLFLYPDSIVINGNNLNRTINGLKEDDWIEYEFLNYRQMIIVHWDGVDMKTGKSISGNYTISYDYKPLKNTPSKEELTSEPVTTRDTVIVTNIVPPDMYYVSGKGKYRQGYKSGIWKEFYENGQIRKEISYYEGVPNEDFKIYREDSSLMIAVELLDKKRCKACKYNSEGDLVECKNYDLLDLSHLY